ncbi:MAG: ABC transporter permease [Candidatus Dormibacteraeota bacterium]|nr:ABC transporter permease [Candidatus Dormibacteraeota bacterium]
MDLPWLAENAGLIVGYLVQHIELTLLAVGVGFAIAIPAGFVAWRVPALRGLLLGIAGVLYTIPSLALFALLVPFTGLTTLTAEIGLVAYTLLALMRNVVVGLDGVSPAVRDAAVGMGYRPLRRFLSVDLPLALPVIIAGVRIATVTTIGLVTVTALIGEGGLGQMLTLGLINEFKTEIWVAGVLCVALAVLADVGLAQVQRVLTPWSRA